MAATDHPNDRAEPTTGAPPAGEGARTDPTTSSLSEMVSDEGVPPAPTEVEPVTNSGITDPTRRSGTDEDATPGAQR